MNMRTLMILSILVTIVTAGHTNRYLKGKRGLNHGYERGYGNGAALLGGAGRSSFPVSTSGLTLSSASATATDSVSGLTLSSAPANEGGGAIVEVPAPDLTATLTASYQAEEGPDYGSGRLPESNSGCFEGFGAGSNSGESPNDFDTNGLRKRGAGDGITGCNDSGPDVGVSLSNIGQATAERQIGEPYLISVHQEVVRKYGVPISRPYPVPTPVNVYVKVEKPVPVPVDRPYAVRVNVPHPVAVDRPYPVPIDRPYPVPVPRAVPVAVPRPYPVPVPHPVPVPVMGNLVPHSTLAAARTIAQPLPLAPPGLAVGIEDEIHNNVAVPHPPVAVPTFSVNGIASSENYGALPIYNAPPQPESHHHFH